jgi:20S proteasome alpha/beta subunit
MTSLSHTLRVTTMRLIIAFLLWATATTNGAKLSDTSVSLDLCGIKPDPYVEAAPLVVAASCRDGVVLLAIHTPDNNDVWVDETGDCDSNNCNSSSNSSNADNASIQDLAQSHRGPLRIHALDGFGSALVCAGWRTDGDALAAKCRLVAADELDRFGEPTNGRVLAYEASFYMAQCAALDTSRALSCVGLLASCGSSSISRGSGDGGLLWLVDATGAYRVRAHAVGNGAKTMNQRLTKVDVSSMSCEECMVQLLKLLTAEATKDEEGWKIPANSRVEMAFVDSVSRRMKRVQQAFVRASIHPSVI